MSNPGNIRLTGTITIPASQLATLRPLLKEHARLTHEEPGCLEFEVTQDPDNPELFNVRELFVDADAFAHHQARGAASEWGQRSGQLQRDFVKTVL